ncbi:hypothetical protein FIBSPDRAFT_899763 [Athelia psychrophila]|uniref:Uncharacterized protein n=1 Tax=Athelia psychrophila TaxID=1759441 RepID=A0A165ZBY6_9AGAM|nr:hypothetical protein FIBSPDRAFT_899763 [Fibularhizoctonia sp. CBS 109695]
MPTSTRERCLVGVQRIQHNTHVFSVSRKCAHEEPARPAAMDVSVGEADGHNTWELHVAVEVPLLERDLPGRHQACLTDRTTRNIGGNMIWQHGDLESAKFQHPSCTAACWQLPPHQLFQRIQYAGGANNTAVRRWYIRNNAFAWRESTQFSRISQYYSQQPDRNSAEQHRPAGAGQVKSSVWCRLARGRTFGTGLAWYLLARKQRGTPAQHGNGWPGGRWGNRLSTVQAGQEHRAGWPGGRWGNQLSVAWAGQRVVSKMVQHRAGWPGGRWGNQLSVAWAGQRVLFKSVQHRVGWPDQDLGRHLRTTLAGQHSEGKPDQDLMSSPTLKTSLLGTLAPDGAWIPTSHHIRPVSLLETLSKSYHERPVFRLPLWPSRTVTDRSSIYPFGRVVARPTGPPSTLLAESWHVRPVLHLPLWSSHTVPDRSPIIGFAKSWRVRPVLRLPLWSSHTVPDRSPMISLAKSWYTRPVWFWTTL